MRSRWNHRVIGRTLGSLVLGLLVLVSVLLAVSATAQADPRYSVMNAPEGVYWRSEPNWAAAERIAGFGVYNGTIIEVHCYQSGTTVEGSSDTMWEQATDVGGSGYGSGWLNEHFINDGQPINQPSPGVPPCGAAPAPPPPSPTGGLVFPIFNAEGGIYYRYGPHWNETTATPGVGVYNGDNVELICGAFGDPVGPYSDTAWSYVNNLSRSVGPGWVNEHFINDGASDNGFVAGEPMCQTGGSGSSGGGSDGSSSSIHFNRSAAVAWAKAHAEDTPPADSACTWFVSNALWAGGLPDSSATPWNSFAFHRGRIRNYPGSLTAWSTPLFVSYIRKTFPRSTYTELDLRAGHTNVPAAHPGDVILYDWNGKSSVKNWSNLDHAALVMWDAPHSQYPEVAEWGADDFLAWGVAVNYKSRGWTWSKVSNKWLQEKHPNTKAFLLHIDTGG
jgi:hypothetical protein